MTSKPHEHDEPSESGAGLRARDHADLLHRCGRSGKGAYTGPSGAVLNDCDDQGDELAMLGYHRAQVVGDEEGLHYELFEHAKQREQWVVMFCTFGSYTTIACETWPDLIDLLAKLSPIVAAADDRGRTAVV